MINLKMRTFDLAEALSGKPVVTRKGDPVTNLQVYSSGNLPYPLRATVHYDQESRVIDFRLDGSSHEFSSSADDLFMKVHVKRYWVWIAPHFQDEKRRASCFFETREEAMVASLNYSSSFKKEAILTMVEMNEEYCVKLEDAVKNKETNTCNENTD